MNFEFIATYVELQDIPSYSTTISVEGQVLKLSFMWNERIGKRTLYITDSADQCYLQNTILHPNEPFELNANAVFNDLPYSVTLVKTGDTNKVGNIFNWSKDFILCFSRTVDLDVKKLNVVYGVTTPSTPILPPSNGGGNTINAVYDGFYQTMTVTGAAGKSVSTKDSNGNVIGSGVIGVSGTVTYSIDEDMLLGGTIISTNAEGSNVVDHDLVASLVVESDDGTPAMFYFLDNYFYQDYGYEKTQIANDAQGRIIVEWLDLVTNQKEVFESTIANLFTNNSAGYNGLFIECTWANWSTTNTVRTTVRYDLDIPVFTMIQYASHIKKFYDDGVATAMGYRLGDYLPNLKQIPSYLPKCVTNLNAMFMGIGETLFNTPDVANPMADWDVSHVTSMDFTFAYTEDLTFPISLWQPDNLVRMSGFMKNTLCTGSGVSSVSNWKTPKLQFADEAFVQSEYVTDMSQWCVPLITTKPIEFDLYSNLTPAQLPVWGTCPT